MADAQAAADGARSRHKESEEESRHYAMRRESKHFTASARQDEGGMNSTDDSGKMVASGKEHTVEKNTRANSPTTLRTKSQKRNRKGASEYR